MSCRVFERGIEDAFIYAIAEAAQEEDVRSIAFDFAPTEKNDPAKTFLDNKTTNGILQVRDQNLPRWITLV